MDREGEASPGGGGYDFLAYAAKAREAGAVRIDTPDSETFVVASRQQTSSAPQERLTPHRCAPRPRIMPYPAKWRNLGRLPKTELNIIGPEP